MKHHQIDFKTKQSSYIYNHAIQDEQSIFISVNMPSKQLFYHQQNQEEKIWAIELIKWMYQRKLLLFLMFAFISFLYSNSKIYQKALQINANNYFSSGNTFKNSQNIKIEQNNQHQESTIINNKFENNQHHNFNSFNKKSFPQQQKRSIKFLSPQIISTQVNQAVRWININNDDLQQNSTLVISQRQYYANKYAFSSFQQLPFCVVVPTFNNSANNRHLINIRSIVKQEYSNFRVIIIDDASEDSTANQIQQYLQQQNQINPTRFKLIRNQRRMKAMVNLRWAALNYCKPNEIFLIVDGDDSLLGRQSIKVLNYFFQKTGAWFVYSNFIDALGSLGYSRPIPQQIRQKGAYRQYPFVTSHLRAFYTKLFVNIKQQDLKDSSEQYYRAANDVAICLPIMQQAHQRIHYIPELLYVYNSKTGLNNHLINSREQQINTGFIIRKPRYQKLDHLFAQQTAIKQSKMLKQR